MPASQPRPPGVSSLRLSPPNLLLRTPREKNNAVSRLAAAASVSASDVTTPARDSRCVMAQEPSKRPPHWRIGCCSLPPPCSHVVGTHAAQCARRRKPKHHHTITCLDQGAGRAHGTVVSAVLLSCRIQHSATPSENFCSKRELDGDLAAPCTP